MKTNKTFNWSRFFTTSGYIVIVVGVILLSVSLYHQIQANEHLTEENAVIISGSTRYSDSTALGDASRQTTQKILFISSYDPTNAYYQDQITGMLSVSDTNNIEFDVVNMDAAKHKSQSDREIFDQDIRHCLASDHYSGVIVAGDPALKYVMSHQDENFKDLPVVFYGVVNRKLGKTAAKDPHITGYLEADHVADTIDMARTLLPGTKRVVAIHDNSAVGVTYGKVFNRLSKNLKYTGLTFETLNLKQYTSKSLKKVVAKYKKGTVLLLMSAHVDQNGNYYTSPEITRIVSSAASVPVFRNGKGGYNNGAVAGQISDYMKTAAKAVRLMHNVLTGKVDLAKVGVTATNADAIDVASYKAMQKFHLDFDALPDHTMLVGAPNSYYRDSYRPVIYALVVVLAGFAMIFAGSRFDIAKRKHTEKRLQRLTEHLRESSRHDPLTALYTRQTAGKRLDALDQQGKPYAIVTIDLDNFKDINEIYGHRAGDRLIQVVALELRDLAEANGGVAARYSGDSFILFFPNRQLQEDDAVLRRIQGVFKRRRTVDHNTITLQASISAANSEPDMPYKDVLLWCETAMQIGKRRGKNTCVFYGRQMKADAAAAEAKRAAVLSAIQHDGFTMVYQPQVETKSGRLIGFEALVRMKDGAMGPGEFIPIAEENGWIQQIGRITTELTIRQICIWRNKQLNPPPVSINYSIGQLSDTDYLTYLKQCLVMYAVPVEAIRLEITESLFIRKEREAARFFEAAAAMDIRFMMDDFGTGYSSLAMLQRLPVSEVKIDKSLLDNHFAQSDDRFLNHVIELIHDDGKRALCEGVETKAQRSLLNTLGCDLIQGYYFGKPGSPDQAEGAIRKGTLDPELD